MPLPEADFEMTEQAMREHNRYRGDENLYVKFFTHPLENREKSLEAGRPIFIDAEFINIMVPGDKSNVIIRQVREKDKERFPRQYAAYRNQEEELIEGTPLEQWGFLTAARCEEMKFFNIRTVEQLANLSDANAQKFMGVQRLKKSAQEYLEAKKTDAPVLQLQEELAKRDVNIIDLNDVVVSLQKRLKKLEGKEGDSPEKKGFFGV